jgi:Endodeoxyribonuclease RusA
MESEQITFVVEGKPLTWQRASRGRYGPSYTPADRENQMTMIRDRWRDLGLEAFDREQSLALGVVVYCKRPSTHFRSNGALKDWAALARPRGGEHGGDLDNFVKLVKDALQTVAYEDDTQIVEFLMPTAKRYVEPGKMPRTEITLALALPPVIDEAQESLLALAGASAE